MSFLTPLGLIFPELFKAKDAWGEWDTETVKEMIGYLPKGMEKMASIWEGLMPDYTIKGMDEGLKFLSISYIISALVGITMVMLFTYLVLKFLKKNA
ncbi:MAG: cobalamin biosynthesis protein [Elusimicrobiota bacterium]